MTYVFSPATVGRHLDSVKLRFLRENVTGVARLAETPSKSSLEGLPAYTGSISSHSSPFCKTSINPGEIGSWCVPFQSLFLKHAQKTEEASTMDALKQQLFRKQPLIVAFSLSGPIAHLLLHLVESRSKRRPPSQPRESSVVTIGRHPLASMLDGEGSEPGILDKISGGSGLATEIHENFPVALPRMNRGAIVGR